MGYSEYLPNPLCESFWDSPGPLLFHKQSSLLNLDMYKHTQVQNQPTGHQLTIHNGKFSVLVLMMGEGSLASGTWLFQVHCMFLPVGHSQGSAAWPTLRALRYRLGSLYGGWERGFAFLPDEKTAAQAAWAESDSRRSCMHCLSCRIYASKWLLPTTSMSWRLCKSLSFDL